VKREKRHAARRAARTAVSSRFVVLTGVSGSGKSQAMRALEDLGYFCVDNLPLMLLPTFAELTQRPDTELEKAAVVIDIREGALLSHFPKVFATLRRMDGLNPRLIFLEASDAALARRFSETRRPHPLAPHRSAMEGVREERARLASLRKMADEIIDTSDMNVHELREAFMSHSIGTSRTRGPVVTFLSFGFKHGLPLDADLVFDVRFLPNPHFIAKLREKTGRDRAVVQFLNQFDDTREFLTRTVDLLRFLIPRYAREGKSYVTVGIGCTGGRHRSVVLAEALARELRSLQATHKARAGNGGPHALPHKARTARLSLDGVRLRVKHRDVAND
jgi:RNase adapter protein RapZ